MVNSFFKKILFGKINPYFAATSIMTNYLRSKVIKSTDRFLLYFCPARHSQAHIQAQTYQGW